ncbi:hypothetical protein SAY87_028906 [Trapa incisa]|uniref:Methyltransferase n=1 Tax=Trapa incisa TaxID=236973 RepID=A0AAN7L3Q6_9MYRT|nr:hypothetical protein SAY87_028906 [Trapa incisa]
MLLLEVDRVLKPGGYFVLTSPSVKSEGSSGNKQRIVFTPLEKITQEICWSLLAQQDETFVWQKTSDAHCYSTRKQASIPVCKGNDVLSYYQPLVSCISGSSSSRWSPIQNETSSFSLSPAELQVHGKYCFTETGSLQFPYRI